MQNTEATIRKLIHDIGGISLEADGNADLYLDLGFASVHALELLTELEERFGLHIPDESFIEANTISRLAQLVDRRLEEPSVSHAG